MRDQLALQEKELAKEMDGLNLTQSANAGAGAGAADGVKKYNKSSFFDEISCDVLDRAQGEPKTLQANEPTACVTTSYIFSGRLPCNSVAGALTKAMIDGSALAEAMIDGRRSCVLGTL